MSFQGSPVENVTYAYEDATPRPWRHRAGGLGRRRFRLHQLPLWRAGPSAGCQYSRRTRGPPCLPAPGEW